MSSSSLTLLERRESMLFPPLLSVDSHGHFLIMRLSSPEASVSIPLSQLNPTDKPHNQLSAYIQSLAARTVNTAQ